MGSARDRELRVFAIVAWHSLAGIVLVLVRLVLGRPFGLWRGHRRPGPK